MALWNSDCHTHIHTQFINTPQVHFHGIQAVSTVLVGAALPHATDMLRDDQLADLRVLFDLFDHDGDGYLEVEEVGTILAACGLVMTEAEVHQCTLLPAWNSLAFSLPVSIVVSPSTRPYRTTRDSCVCPNLLSTLEVAGTRHGHRTQTQPPKAAVR